MTTLVAGTARNYTVDKNNNMANAHIFSAAGNTLNVAVI